MKKLASEHLIIVIYNTFLTRVVYVKVKCRQFHYHHSLFYRFFLFYFYKKFKVMKKASHNPNGNHRHTCAQCNKVFYLPGKGMEFIFTMNGCSIVTLRPLDRLWHREYYAVSTVIGAKSHRPFALHRIFLRNRSLILIQTNRMRTSVIESDESFQDV